MGSRLVDAASDLRATATAVVALVRDRRLSVAAAGIAYYAFNALLPTLVLAILVVSASEYVAQAADALSRIAEVAPTDVRVVASAIQDGQGFWRLAALAGVVAAWSTFKLGRALADSFAVVYGDADHSRLERVADVVVVFLTWVVALALVVVLGAGLAYLDPVVALDAAWPAVLFVALLVAFLPTYLVFPPSVSLPEALPGATLAAAAWTLSGVVFRAYAESATSVEFFGVVGVVLLFLTWLYVGSLALLVGAATNVVLADRVAEPRT